MSKKCVGKFPKAFRQRAVDRLNQCENIVTLQRRGATPAERQRWRAGITAQIRALMSRQGGLRIERMCQLAQVSRAGFYPGFLHYEPNRVLKIPFPRRRGQSQDLRG